MQFFNYRNESGIYLWNIEIELLWIEFRSFFFFLLCLTFKLSRTEFGYEIDLKNPAIFNFFFQPHAIQSLKFYDIYFLYKSKQNLSPISK